jgi:DNA-binding NarL/FixJ family response regulator
MQICSAVDAGLQGRDGQEAHLLLVGEGEAWRVFATRLQAGARVECCAGFENIARFLRSSRYRSVVFDWSQLQGLSGRELCRLARDVSPDVGVVAATAPQAVGDRVQALEAGFDDCVTYEIEVSELIARMRAITRRRFGHPPQHHADEVRERASALARAYRLSGREHEALLLLAQGTHLKEIAVVVGCGYSTIRTHLRRLCRKLGCTGTREVIIKLFAFDASLGAVYPKRGLSE